MHTQGPWEYFEQDKWNSGPFGQVYCCVRAATGRVIVNGTGAKTDPEAVANARLIAAAPDLLAACKAYCKAQEYVSDPERMALLTNEALDLMLVAIAKAEGKEA